ncbi:hypothetical protein BDV41DRAFT_519677 [Aspergillus transmontanensis]|uniref:Uncharacterized protein n=1 Tax=Aspergillus transmontanensis TaxID=1034304 RepID=A0A5N6WEQ5_9EURO|nr:hypothetical protein BDV41DRAFT_519677 [Aspergillus transmontanensis]
MTNPPDQITIPLLHTVHTHPSHLHAVRSIFVVGEREVTLSTFHSHIPLRLVWVPQPPQISLLDNIRRVFIHLFFPILLFIFYVVLVPLHLKCLS